MEGSRRANYPLLTWGGSDEKYQHGTLTLHTKKAPGFDDVTTEHIKYAGPLMVDLLCFLFNAILECEYIPCCFRRGVQVPLYKGKDTNI